MVGYPSQENNINSYLNEYPPETESELYPNGASPITIHDFPERTVNFLPFRFQL